MQKLILKIAAAKKEIKNTKVKKLGRNTYSEYDYFLPSQIEEMVFGACENNGLLTKFDLVRDQYGIYGELSIWDTATGNMINYKMATDIPSIKATNIAQQLGGCVTYTERYLKMSAFGIMDNTLDPDTTQNTKAINKAAQAASAPKQPAAPQQQNTAQVPPQISEKQLEKVLERVRKFDFAAYDGAIKAFTFTAAQRAKLNETYDNYKKVNQ